MAIPYTNRQGDFTTGTHDGGRINTEIDRLYASLNALDGRVHDFEAGTAWLLKSGGQMTGALLLVDTPTQANEAIPKTWAEAHLVKSVCGLSGTVTLTAANVGAAPSSHVGGTGAAHGNATGGVAGFMSSADYTKLSGIQTGAINQTTADGRYIQTSAKGAANGVATLGSDSKIPSSQLPAIAITNTYVCNTQAAMLALTAEEGDICVRTDLPASFVLQAQPASTLANWTQLLTPTDLVLSVNTKTGAVVLTTSDIAEGTRLYYTDARADARVQNAKATAPPSALGTAAVGDSLYWARANHVHAMPTAANVGAAPSSHVGATGAAHGNATTSAAGFMSAADKTIVDALANIFIDRMFDLPC